MFAGDNSLSIFLIDTETGLITKIYGFKDFTDIYVAALSPDRMQIAAVGSGLVQRCHAYTGEVILSAPANGDRWIGWHPNGSFLAFIDLNLTTHILDAATLSQVLKFSSPRPANLIGFVNLLGAAWSPDGLKIAAGGNYSILQIWDPATGSLLYNLPNSGGTIHRIAWSPDGTFIAYMGGVIIVKPETGELVYAHKAEQFFFSGAFAWHPTGNRIAIGEYSPDSGERPRIVEVDLETGKTSSLDVSL